MKLGLIGGADVAAKYASTERRMPPLAFAAVVDGDAVEAARAAKAVGAPQTATSLDELLNKHADACDAVVIHQQPAAMAEQTALAAAQAGKHVLLGAPMASSAAAAGAIIDACQAAGVVLMAGQSRRFQPSQQALKAALDAGNLGEAGLIRIHIWGAGARDAETIALTAGVDALDLATWMFGAAPAQIYTVGGNGYVQIHCGFAAGGMALIDCADTLPAGGAYFSSSLIGGSGAAYADDHRNRNLLFTGGEPRAEDPGEADFALLEQLAEFAAAVAEGREPTVTGSDGRLALQLAETALTSLRSQTPVTL